MTSPLKTTWKPREKYTADAANAIAARVNQLTANLASLLELIGEGGPGGPITMDNVTDATTIGKAVVRAITQAAGRNAIGAAADGAVVHLTDVIDEDDMASNSATKLPTQQSVRAYVLAKIAELIGVAPAELDTWIELVTAIQNNADALAGIISALSGKQPLSTDLTNLVALLTGLSGGTARMLTYVGDTDTWAAIATQPYGRDLLNLANAAALRALLGAGTANATTFLRGDGTWATPAGGGSGGDAPLTLPHALAWDEGTDSWPARPSDGRAVLWIGGAAPTDLPAEWAAGDAWFPATGDNIDLGTVLEALQTVTAAANKIPYFSGSSSAETLDFKTSMDVTASDTAVLSEAGVKAYVDKMPRVTKTGPYNVVVTDLGICIEYNNSTPATFTITDDFTEGDMLYFAQVGTGTLTIAAGTDVHGFSEGSRFKLAGQWAECSARFRTDTDFVLVGSLVA